MSGTDVLYTSRQNDEVGGKEMFGCFKLRHVSAIYLEIRKQDNVFVKGNWGCTLLLSSRFCCVGTGMPFNSATLIGGT